MAYENDQNEPTLPVGGKSNRKSINHLPRYYRTQENSKFLSSTLDQLVQPGVVEKINGYVGRKSAKAFSSTDNYVGDVSTQRQNYQFEPAAVIKDNLGNVTFYNDYNDYSNQLTSLNSGVSDHSILHRQEYYAWEPHLDWDKLSNFREYYWLPNGPQSIPVAGNTIDVESNITVTIGDNVDNNTYIFSNAGTVNNPTITVYRGQKYNFEIDTPNLPFTIKTKRTLNEDFNLDSSAVLVVNGVSIQNLEAGKTEVQFGSDTPDILYYVAANDLNAAGTIIVKDIEEATFINVDNEIVGKRFYKTSNGFNLSNGMKVFFTGEVEPASYANQAFYVEGVGESINLIAENNLNIPSAFADDVVLEFDNEGFDKLPYSRAIGYPLEKDYFVINRESLDGNLWSRYNRWFHRSVIEKSAEINNQPVEVDQSARAKRPIIEFNAGLKLANFGTKAKLDVDLVDNYTTDVFSIIEGSQGYNIDGVDIVNGMRILFTADTDNLVANRIFEVEFLKFDGPGIELDQNTRQIHLKEVEDTQPIENEVVLISNGTQFKGKLFYFNGTKWNLTQDKTSTNQCPLFDVFDSNGYSYTDTTFYSATNFTGTKLFSYQQGTGPNDTELNMPISYRNIDNVGDILFEFNLLNDSFTYTTDNNIFKKNTDVGFLRKYSSITDYKDINGFSKAKTDSNQPIIRQYVFDNSFQSFEIDVYDESGLLDDLWIRVYLNNELQFETTNYVLANNIQNNKIITFNNDLKLDDIVIIKTRSSAPKNDNGYYEIPVNLERNPLNENLTDFTLGEINDHVSSIVEGTDEFIGKYPGVGNLRDLGNVSQYGRRFLQHSCPINLSLYHIINKDANVIKSIDFSRREYAKFKRQFLMTADELGYEGPVKEHVDKIIEEINKAKTNSMPYYFSDMIPLGATRKTTFTVDDVDFTFFGLSTKFLLTEQSRRGVNVYLNSTQLVHGKDYTFNTDGFCVITATKQIDDIIEIYEYETTNGSFVAPTPTKLGLFPKYEPSIYIDNTYLEPTKVIQGHDGSIVVAYNDFRDQLLLELEKRIYNNIKVEYDTALFDIHDYIGGEYRNTGLSRENLNVSLVGNFIEWSNFVESDYTNNNSFDRLERLTFNHKNLNSPSNKVVPGFWRQIYKEAYDTDRPNKCPWEMIGFSIEPTWWKDVYGPAPYTKDNLVLWQDLEAGIVREPNKKIKILKNYKRPGLTSHIPVDENGNISPPIDSGYIRNYTSQFIDDSWVFGDGSPVESAWRKSSEYPFSLLKSLILNNPSKVLSTAFDRVRQVRNKTGQIVYSTTNKRIRLEDIVFPNTAEDATQVYTSGLINYIFNYMSSDVLNNFTEYKNNLSKLRNQLGFKIGGFTDKDKFKLILDSRSPLNQGNVFVPEENYNIFLNTSTPVKTCAYSGVIIERREDGYVVKGYDRNNPYFTYNQTVSSQGDPSINIGGISEPFLEWAPNKTYVAGINVLNQGFYYRSKERHVSGAEFDSTKFAKLSSLPLVGGRDAFIRKQFTPALETISYGTLLPTIQDVVDFLLGYGEYLKNQGFDFESFDVSNDVILNWRHSVNEFLFWTTQNWASGSVITLSPSANILKFNTQYATIDSVYDSFYGFSILKSDGNKLSEEFNSLGRDPNEFILKTKNTEDGVYFIELPLVQKEHICLLDNATVFGDVIYDLQPGYRQERIKILGYRTDDWNGSLNIPGFIYDNAIVQEWESWKDYVIGDIVKYKEFYYTAASKIAGEDTFTSSNWNRLAEKPQPGLYSNFEYKTNQFNDFYDLDSDNFDTEQQKLAQHLIGYQKRDYLENIVNDSVSQYKFYQGFIADKGTQNALTKLFDALASDDKDSLEFYEEWAIKDGQYGASEGFNEIEYKLKEDSFRLTPQPIELVNSVTGKETDLIYRILPSEVYEKPSDYNHNSAFPGKTVLDTYVKNAGYVNQQDVKGIAKLYTDLTNFFYDQIPANKYVWIGTENRTWNVYKHVNTNYEIESLNPVTGGFEITVNATPRDIEIGNVIGVSNLYTFTSVGDDSTGRTSYEKYNLEGFFEVKDIINNTITLISTETVEEITNVRGNITRFTSVRAANIIEANTILQKGTGKDDYIWIDDAGNNSWNVLENTEAYKQLQSLNSVFSGTNNNYGESISVNERNTTMLVGAPDYDDGRVFVYTRPANSVNFVQTQIIEPNVFGDDNERFGASVAITPDAEYAIIGSPNASNVKTKYAGAFVPANDYNKGSIVLKDQSLWQSKVDIQGAEDNISFSSFNSIQQIVNRLGLQADSSPLGPTLLVGNYAIDDGIYAFSNTPVDHFLVRVPLEIYEGSGENDEIKIGWNSYTYSNQSQANLVTTAPFNGDYSLFTKEYLEENRTIKHKIDVILYINSATNVPETGDTLQTSTGSGVVAYVYSDASETVVYLKNINGSFNSADSLFRLDGDFIGQYQKQGPVDEVATGNVLGGYWFLQTGVDYTPTSLTTVNDAGKALVFYDVITDSSSTGRYYYNTRSIIPGVTNSQNTFSSFIEVLSFTGSPGPGGVSGDFVSDKFVVRAPKQVTDITNAGDTIDLFVNQAPTNEIGIVHDLTDINLSTAITNKQHTVYDVWDGYINFNFTKFDSAGTAFEPKVGLIVRDKTRGGTAEVAYYIRNGLNVTIYVKNVTGIWSVGDDYGQNAEIEFIGVPSDPLVAYQVDRTMGQVQFTGLGYSPANIGKLLVLDAPSNIQVPPIRVKIGIECWFYNASNILGVARAVNSPSPINNDWLQVFKIQADSTGTASGLINEGLFSLYKKSRVGIYDFVQAYTVPEKQANFYLGSDVKITKFNNLYRAFVHAKGLQTEASPGRIYLLKDGTENNNTYDWEYAKNKKFKGPFNESLSYFTGDIIYLDNPQGTLYTAKTNIAAGAFDASDWTSTDDVIDYVGYLPNNTGLSVINDSTALPIVLDQDNLREFGTNYDLSKNGDVLIVSALYNSSEPNKVVVYRLNNGFFERSQEILAADNTTGFAHSISISDNGMLIAVSAPYNDDISLDQGLVYVYKQRDGAFELHQTLQSANNERAEMFGWNVEFDGETLAIASRNADSYTKTSIDKFSEKLSGSTYTNDPTSSLSGQETNFDGGFTSFKTVNDDSGVIYVYENFNDNLIFAQIIQIADSNINYFGRNMHIKNNHVYVGLPRVTESGLQGKLIDFRRPETQKVWKIHRKAKETVDIDKIKKVYLYNAETKEFLTSLDYIDPLQGKIAGEAEQEISFKTYFDPATYTINLSSSKRITVDDSQSWGAEHVGEVWWNLTDAKFYNPYQDSVIYSTQNWNELFVGNTIEIYEWVESEVVPSVWDERADTNTYLSQGFSGQSVYGDEVYSTKSVYDSISQAFKTKYYFWVKDKKTVPYIESRKINITDIAKYITDPQASGIKFVAFISPTQFVFYNCNDLIKDNDVAINIQYYTVENQTQNIHNQYSIISQGLETSQPKSDIVKKWFDSLVGYDAQNRIVPDPSLSGKYKYGILNSPRQSWFVNRTEALKQFLERVNLVLDKNLIIDDKDIAALSSNEIAPTAASNHYDTTVDTLADLEFVGVAKAERATLLPIIENGKIVRVEIQSPGRGYRVPPTITITGNGEGAEITTTIDRVGKLSTATIVNQGNNYDTNTSISVRRFTVLVQNDNTIQGKWALYERVQENTGFWNRIKSQSYDVANYWDYKDWYATNYNELTNIDYLIDNSYELTSLDDRIGDIVKIENVGTGGWLLLKKDNNIETTDYTVNYSTVGRQNGTIQFKNTLYDFASSSIGFDTISFDTRIYDSEPVQELKIILNTIKDDLFIDDLLLEFNNLFFASLRYVFSEQKYVDWAFKTNFIKAKHNAGKLRKDITFNNDNLPSYEAYVKEVKPFATKIREYLSSYEGLDNTRSVVTDFDLPPIYKDFYKAILPESVKVLDNSLIGVDADIETYPNKNWLDNSTYKLINVDVVVPGSGYTSPPQIRVEGGGGQGAELKSYLGRNGRVSKVDIINPGYGYYSTPTITVDGNLLEDGEPARLSVQIGDSPVRHLHTIVKFDRITGTYLHTVLSQTETFTGTGKTFDFTLTWPMDLQKTNVEVTLNGIVLLDSEYKYVNVLDTAKGYDRYFGKIQITEAPSIDSVIVVKYKKSIELLTAQDRINNYYEDEAGKLGKDLGQLMEGIDYGGVEVRSLTFGGSGGWDDGDWYSDTWDTTYDTSFEDEIFELDGSTISIELSKPLENSIQYNIYLNGVRIDDPNFGTGDPVSNPNARCQSITGDGVQTTIFLDNDGLNINGEGSPADSEYNNGALIAENNGTVFDRALTVNGLKLVVAGAVGGQTAVPDEWAKKTARTFELMTDPNGAGINTTHQRNFLKTLKGDVGTKHAGIPTVQRVGYGGGSTYTPNWLEDAGIAGYAGLQAFNDSVAQKDMVWYKNINGNNPPTQRRDIEEIFEHIFHTIHAFGIPGAVPGSSDAVEMNPDIRIENEPSFDWQNTALHLAMKEAIDAGLYDPSGYATDWNTDPEAAAVAYTEYTYLVNWSMWDMSVYWDGGSLSPEWDDSLKTPAGMLANNPLGYALFNAYFAPVLSKPNFATIESIFGENDTGVSGYVVDVISSGDAVGAGDAIIFRKSTSDGTFLINEQTYDSIIQGGNLNYSTATGLSAEDIVVDGDGFVTPTTSNGPEELVPGQILDTVDIKVYERPKGGASPIVSRVYTGDGVVNTFEIDDNPILASGLFVKVGYRILDSNEYTVNYQNNTITITEVPAANTRINISSLGVSGTNILDIDQFTADGSTAEFLTNVRWSDNLSHYATVNGVKVSDVIFESDNTYEMSGNAVLSLSSPPAADSIIRFAFFENSDTDVKNFSEVLIDNFVADGSTTSFTLSQTPFTQELVAWFTVVKVNDKILNAGYNKRFITTADKLEYKVDEWQVPAGSTDSNKIKVFLNKRELTYVDEWTFVGNTSTVNQDSTLVRLSSSVQQQDGDILDFYILDNGEYKFGYFDESNNYVATPGILQLDNAYNEDDKITVYQFSNHDSQGFERQQFDVVDRFNITNLDDGSTVAVDDTTYPEDWYQIQHLRNGLIELRNKAIDAQYVWVTINGVLMMPNVDYYVTDNRKYIKIEATINENDTIEVIQFGEPTKSSIGWRQFKDMLNRNHYKRLDGSADITLAEDLYYYDNEIKLINSDSLVEPEPNSKTPSVIFINGERIEYFIKDGNKLKQLRRGTLGTGTKEVYPAGTEIYNQSSDATMPYKDEILTTTLIADGMSSSYTLDFTPESVNEFEIFVAGKRLRKNTLNSYIQPKDNNDVVTPITQDSQEGDEVLPAEFSINGNEVVLSQIPLENQRIIIIRKQGKIWNDAGIALIDADSDISRFLRAKSPDLPR